MIDQLRDAIRGSGMSYLKLAQASGVGDDQLSRFMSGKRSLTLPAVDKICRTLGLHLAGGPAVAGEKPPARKKPRPEAN